MGTGYVERPDGVTAEYIRDGVFDMQVAGEMIPAVASLKPMCDPRGERIRM